MSEHHILIIHEFRLTKIKKNLKIQMHFIPLVHIMNITMFL